MPETAPFRFKHVRKGAPITPEEVPKLPPAAARLIARARAGAHAVDESPADVLHRLAIGIVTVCLRRLEPGLTEQQVEDDEDYSETVRLYNFIIKQNPDLFPPLKKETANDG